MNYIYWFGTKFASFEEYSDLCRRSGEPVVLRYCSTAPDRYADSVHCLKRVLEETPECLVGIVVDGPLELTDRIVRIVDGRTSILFRKSPNPFRGETPSAEVSSPFGGGGSAEFLWLSEEAMPLRQELALRSQFDELTIHHCRPGDGQLGDRLARADYVGTDLSASWVGALMRRTSAVCLYPVCDELGSFRAWRRVDSLRMETFSLPWIHCGADARKRSA